MTRNTFTKARIFLAMNVTKTFAITQKVDRKAATRGIEYCICYNGNEYERYFAPADGSAGNFTYHNNYTHFPTFDAAKKYFKEHKAEIVAAAKRYYKLSNCSSVVLFNGKPSKFKFTKTTVSIRASFHVYRDTITGIEYHSLTEVEKVCKNHLIIKRERVLNINGLIDKDLSFYTLERGKDFLLFEFYQIEYNDGKPRIILHKKNKPFKIYNNKKAFYCRYNEKSSKYTNAEELYQDDGNFQNSVYYRDSSFYNGYNRSIDANERYIREDDYSYKFTDKSLKIIKDFGIPEYFFTGYGFSPSDVSSIAELAVCYLSKKDNMLYNSSETQICKDVTDFLANIPFDKEHSVVKFRNGYILRLGKIVQIYKHTYTRSDGHTVSALADHPVEGDNSDQNELVYEKYVEFARLFISNNFSTRSLSLATEGGRRWRHDGIHLVGNLFQSNPAETHLDVDVEENNRAALVQLYTVHPRLKYMKNYMEQHPDVLYNSCVPFLRALFQYNMILETFIALKKDSIFWTPVTAEQNSRRYYYSYRSRGDNYTKKKETFDIENFVQVMSLTDIPQTGDFYQRLGLTKQQFKLIFANVERWETIARVVFRIHLTIPGESESFSRDGRWTDRDKVKFKLVSYEEFRMAVEITNTLIDKGEEYYSIYNDIDDLNSYYHGMQRVYKAIVTKGYDCSLLIDYLRMRNRLAEVQFPDFKLSIWDMFPDDNEDLRRYHDRIMFLYGQHQACEILASKLSYNVRAILNPETRRAYTAQELYLYCKERNMSVEEMTNLFRISDDIRAYSDGIINANDIINTLPNSSEELEEYKEKFVKMRKLLQNLHYMYWEDDWPQRYRGSSEKSRARSNWGGQDYESFLTAQLSNNLDKDKYDLYLRLRRKFIENMEGFRVDNYPIQLNDEASLERLYQDLASQEPNLNQMIEYRESERRRRIQEELEAKTLVQQKKYIERYKQLKVLNYEDGSDRCIIVPQNLVSLIVEGQTLHHCVGSFVDSVSEGKDTIVFLRKTEDKDNPYVTISLQPDGKLWFIDQAHGDHNSDISEEDVKFLQGWAEAKGIILTSVKQHYGAHCHN